MQKNSKILIGVFIIIAVLLFSWLGIGLLFVRPVQLKISGSTTCLPIISEAADDYMVINTNYSIEVSGGGSSVGVTQVGEGTVDIGMASRPIKTSERKEYPGMNQIPFARDGIAVIISKSATHGVTTLTMDQVKKIYNGEYKKWSDVGGTTGDLIVLMGRDSASGTRASFEEITGLKKDAKYDTYKANIEEYNSNGGVHSAVVANPNAIGYVGLGYVDSEIKSLKINGIAPTVATIQAGSYPISRNLYLITLGEISAEEKLFIDFVLSEEGQAIVKAEGFIPL
ncbi:MAG: phosphate ABC transporter substrate-binding protein [Promethearchaeota archaeon]